MALYNLIFQGEIIDGTSLEEVKSNISRLFKADADKTAQLFSGKPIVIKKNLDEESSKKYLSILNKAGAVIQQVPLQSTISPVEINSQTQKPIKKHQKTPTVQNSNTLSGGLSAGLSALVNYNQPIPTPVESTAEITTEHEQTTAEPEKTNNTFIPSSDVAAVTETEIIQSPEISQGLQLAPENAPALSSEKNIEAVEIGDISHLSMSEALSGSLQEFTPEVTPAELPDISELSMSEALSGSLEEFAQQVIAQELPDTSSLTMSEALSGSLEEFSEEVIPAELPDISDLSMSEAQQGSLEGIEKKPEPIAIPDTSHLDFS